LLIKQVFKDGDDAVGELYLAWNPLMFFDEFIMPAIWP
jgi:hypothetical protein